MAFVAALNSDLLAQSAYDTMVITDGSSWDTLVKTDFTSRSIAITNSDGDTPAGHDASIPFPFVDGLGDELEVVFPTDLAFTLVLTYVPVTPNALATFTKTITTIFDGNAKSTHSSRVTKSELTSTIKAASVPQYIATTSRLSGLIDAATYEASVGNLASAQNLIDQAGTFDTDKITY